MLSIVLAKSKKIKIIVAAAIVSASVLCGSTNSVYAAPQGMTPEEAAQELARLEEQARVAQAARDQAASDAAVRSAQMQAQQNEASELYFKWGVSLTAPSVNSMTPSTGIPATTVPSVNALSPMTQVPAIPPTAYIYPNNVAKVNPKDAGVTTVDLVIFAGQSNMSGTGGNASLAPKVVKGYEFRATSDPTGLYPITEPFGVRETGYMGESPIVKQGSLVAAFSNAYYRKSGTPIVAVSASRGGTDSAYWTSADVRADLLSRFVKAKTYLTNNGYIVRHKYLVWLQGESDSNGKTSQEQYQKNLEAAFSSLFTNGLEQVFIITPGYAQGGVIFYDDVINAQKNLCAKSNNFTLASELLRKLPPTDEYMSDAVHYNQKALNMVGADAANRIALGY